MGIIIKNYWYWIISILFIIVEALFLFFLNDGIYASAHDNLELHVLDYHLLKETGSFFSHGTSLPILNGISRDYFASEISFYSILYYLLPTNTAYILGYVLKTVIALLSFLLLFKEIFKQQFKKYEPLVVLIGMAYGLLPLYPTFSFSFVSLPYLLWIIIKIYKDPKIRFYILLLTYPVFSYFTFFGVFILGYLVLSVVVIWILKKDKVLRILITIPVLAVGYILCEYRLFNTMLFHPVETIRSTMIMASYNWKEIIASIWETFSCGIFHAEAVHTYFILPLVFFYLIFLFYKYSKRHQFSDLLKDKFILIIFMIMINCLIYGLYFWEPFRTLIEKMLPPVKGLQFNRTVFFNPLLWYFALFIFLKRLYDANKRKVANALALLAIAVVLCSGTKYNDLYNTVFNYTYQIIKNQKSNNLTYQEYYSEALFSKIKNEIDYNGEKSVAYGIDPGILAYSGISTLDGCLSYYPLDYKEQFRKIIAPALALNQDSREYFDDWGARAYLYPGSEESIYQALRIVPVTDTRLFIDVDELKKLGGKYLFSRIKISNEEELGLNMISEYQDENSPYTIYLYDTERDEVE